MGAYKRLTVDVISDEEDDDDLASSGSYSSGPIDRDGDIVGDEPAASVE